MNKNIIYWKWTNEEKYKKSYRQSDKQSDKQEKNKKNILNNISFHIENKREEIGAKLSQREMITQIGLNPFSKNSYENDITNYDNCMKVKNQN
jgi:hypothetical protein